MPATFEKNKNGRWVLTGNPGVEQAYEPEQPPAAVKPKVKPKPKGFLERIGNDLKYEANQLLAHPERSYQRAVKNAAAGVIAGAPGGGAMTPAMREGTIGAGSNAARVLMEATQKVMGIKGSSTGIDEMEDRLQRLIGNKAPSQMTTGEFQAYGMKSSTVLNLAANAVGPTLQGLKFVGPTATKIGNLLNAGFAQSKVGAVARTLAAAGASEAITTPLDDNRGGSAFSLINAIAGREIMKDPVQPGMSIGEAGIAAWAPNAAFGGALGVGSLGVSAIFRNRKALRANSEIGKARSALEENGVTQSNAQTGQTAFTNEALAPRQANAGLDEMFGLGQEKAPAPAPAPGATAAPTAAPAPTAPGAAPLAPDGTFDYRPDNLPPFREEPPLRSDPFARAAPDRKGIGYPDPYSPVQEWLRVKEAAKTPDAANYDQWLEQNQQIRGIPSEQMERGGAVQGEFQPTTREPIDPWIEEYDPTLPEADAAYQVFDQLDDDELRMVATQPSPLEAANQLVSGRVQAEVNPQTRTSMTAAPAEMVAEPIGTWRDQWESANTATLRDLASPDNSPELFEKIQNITGRDWEQFTKADVIDGLELLHQDGITVLPNRLTGGQMLPIEDIDIDPIRLQYKQGIDEQGQQLGNSLAGVEKWNPDMEGTILVWEDPANGKTYVVNGHNRFAAAQRMGIPSMRVEYITAATAEQARMRGALANIAEGSGTPFDAAKAFKGMGIADESQMKSMGMPLKSGVGKEGLALSKLPDNIFQDTVDGRISTSKAVALGQAGLDETGMQQAYKALQGKDMSDATWGEVLQQARSAPVVQGTQVDLFGNTDSMNLMVQKGQLAAAIKAELVSDKNLMKKVGNNAGKLNEIGSNQIDIATTQQVGMDAQMLIGEFDAGKYAEGHPFSELLNQGAEDVAAGGRLKVIARRIKQQIAELGEQMPATAVEKAPAEDLPPPKPKRLTAKDRAAAKAALVKDAAAKGEVRPPATPMPELFADSTVDIPKVKRELEAGIISDDALRMIDDELQLEKAYAERDAEAALAQTQAVRDDAEYELLTFNEKQAHGTMPDLFETEVLPAETLPSVADAFEKAAKEMAESDARMFRSAGKFLSKAKESLAALDDLDLDGRAAYAREQRIAAEAAGDTTLAGEWKNTERRLERDRIAQAQRRQATSQEDMFGAGQYDTSTPLLNAVQEAPVARTIEIPPSAYRKITTKTSQAKLEAAASSLMAWTGGDFNATEALQLVKAKGAILDPDALPGIDMNAAREQGSIGRVSPEVRAAYEDFYGLRTAEHFKTVEVAAIDQKLAIDNEMNQVRNQASKEGC